VPHTSPASREPVAKIDIVTDIAGQQQLLYFTTSSLSLSGRAVWYINEVNGQPNLHRLDITSRTDRQLTHYSGGRLWQYQGFDGPQNRGLAVWSVASDAQHALL